MLASLFVVCCGWSPNEHIVHWWDDGARMLLASDGPLSIVPGILQPGTEMIAVRTKFLALCRGRTSDWDDLGLVDFRQQVVLYVRPRAVGRTAIHPTHS
jgi:hypothetical protein